MSDKNDINLNYIESMFNEAFPSNSGSSTNQSNDSGTFDNSIGIEYKNGDMYDGNGNFVGNESTGSKSPMDVTFTFNDVFNSQSSFSDNPSDSTYDGLYNNPKYNDYYTINDNSDTIKSFGEQSVSDNQNLSNLLNVLKGQYNQNNAFNQKQFDFVRDIENRRFELSKQQFAFNQQATQQQLASLNNFRQSQLALNRQQLEAQNNYNNQMLDLQKQREENAMALGNRRLDLLQQQNDRMYGIAKSRNDKLNALTDKQMSLIEQQVSALKQQLEANQWAFQVRKNEYNRMSNLRSRLTSSYMHKG